MSAVVQPNVASNSAMKTWIVAIAVALCMMACSDQAARDSGRIVIAITVDWEGAYGSPDGQAALVDLQENLGGAPMTHFVSAAYFVRGAPDPAIAQFLQSQARGGAELAMHLHAWSSLVRAAGIEPRRGPSFMTGTDKLFALESGEDGFDVDLDAYSTSELLRLLRVSRDKLQQQGLAISHSFRAGGYLASSSVRHALRADGYQVDSSAVDYRAVAATNHLASRLREVWPAIDVLVPQRLDGLVELPIAAVADYTTPQRMGELIDAAAQRLQRDPGRDVYLTIALHQETAADHAGVVADALSAARKRLGADTFLFTTSEKLAFLASR